MTCSTIPKFLAFVSAQKRVAIRGKRVRGTSIANMPSINDQIRLYPLSRIEADEESKCYKAKRRTSPSPPYTLQNSHRDIWADEPIDEKGERDQSRDETAPFECCEVGNDDLCEELKAAGCMDGWIEGWVTLVMYGDHDSGSWMTYVYPL